MKFVKRILIGFAILLVAALLGGLAFWSLSTKAPDSRAIDALESQGGILVTEGEGLLEFSSKQKGSIGFIFYPSGGVNYRAYSPQMQLIAGHGIRVFLVEMPFNIAFLGANRAAEIIASHPEITTWAVGGHSLGGVAAADFAAHHPEVDALVLWASYPADNALLETNLRVLSVCGTRDGLTTLSDIHESKALLPPDTVFAAIEGANHAQFGSYGAQNGDNTAEISAGEQARRTAGITSQFLLELTK